ncbi:MAG TPA: Spy/CpxP family protein refolding chaperone [Gemmatimonadaceae bacterium]
MRRMLLVLVAGSVAACANEVTAPTSPTPENALSSAPSASVNRGGPWGFGRRGFGMMGPGGGMMLARRLPANLALTDAQKTQIRGLMTAYRSAHQQDLNSLATVGKQMRAARVAGQRLSVDQRKAFFAQMAPQRQRLMTANKQLAADIQKVLTSDQKAWLVSHRPSFRRNANHVRRSA